MLLQEVFFFFVAVETEEKYRHMQCFVGKVTALLK